MFEKFTHRRLDERQRTRALVALVVEEVGFYEANSRTTSAHQTSYCLSIVQKKLVNNGWRRLVLRPKGMLCHCQMLKLLMLGTNFVGVEQM